MAQRLPDELFRKGSAGAEEPAPRPRRRVRREVLVEQSAPLPKESGGISLPWMVLLVVVLLAGAFQLGRAVPSAKAPVVSASPIAESPSSSEFIVYDGPVYAMEAFNAVSDCDGLFGASPASGLIDGDVDSIWRCPGNGEGQAIRFAFYGDVELVGLRVVNGNTVDGGAYLAERRITSIRWDFADGNYFEQGLAANDTGAQEVRFPRIVTSTVTLTVRAASAPGNGSEGADAVSISGLEFLSPA